MEIPRYLAMYKILLTMITIFSMLPFFSSNTFAEETPVAFAPLDVSIEFDPAVKGFQGDISIVLKDPESGRQYQYVFRQSQNYILPDNPIKVIANITYTIDTYIHNTADVTIAGADGEPPRDITVPASGAKLVLRVINNAACETGEPEQTTGERDISSLIPVMDRFYENTAHAVNGDMVNRLELWTGGTTKKRFLRDPNHTQEQWDSLSLYERANYLALTIIPFDMLFTYKSVNININDKTSFTKPLLSDIDYLRAASTDGGAYYNEICKVIDWIWDYYLQSRGFINVIDEYNKIKTDTDESTGSANEGVNTPSDETSKQASTLAENTAASPDEASAQTSVVIQNNEAAKQNNRNDAAAASQNKLIEKLKNNIVLIAIAALLVFIFLGLRKINQERLFQSYEKTDRDN